MNKFQIELLRKNVFFDFGSRYFGPKEQIRLAKGWDLDEALVSEFHQFVLKQGAEFTEAEFTENHGWVKSTLKHELYLTAFNKEEADKTSLETDEYVIKAIDALPKAKGLMENAKKMLVQRTNPAPQPAPRR